MPNGNPGKPRPTGRKPQWFRIWCDEAIRSEHMLKKLKGALESEDFEVWWPVFKEIQVIANGKPPQQMEITGLEGSPLGIVNDSTIRGLTEALRQRIAGANGSGATVQNGK